jgi:hypothetical protein
MQFNYYFNNIINFIFDYYHYNFLIFHFLYDYFLIVSYHLNFLNSIYFFNVILKFLNYLIQN